MVGYWTVIGVGIVAVGAIFGWLASLRLRVGALEQRLAERQSKLRALAVELIRAEEEQRARIARELHDGLGQMMTAVNIELQVLQQAASPDLQPLIDDVRALSAQVMTEMRRISHELRPAILDEIGLSEAVRALVRRMSRQVSVSLEIQGNVDLLPADSLITCYRLVQEALNNVVRHSQAKRAVITLRRHADLLSVTVTDDGRGIEFDPATTEGFGDGHFGLLGLDERIRAIGGTFRVARPHTGGTRLEAELPAQ